MTVQVKAKKDQAQQEATCHDCGTPVDPNPAFKVLRCIRCAIRAGREDRGR